MNALSGHLKGNLVLVVLTELIGSMLSVVSIRGFNSYKVTKGRIRVLGIQMKDEVFTCSESPGCPITYRGVLTLLGGGEE